MADDSQAGAIKVTTKWRGVAAHKARSPNNRNSSSLHSLPRSDGECNHLLGWRCKHCVLDTHDYKQALLRVRQIQTPPIYIRTRQCSSPPLHGISDSSVKCYLLSVWQTLGCVSLRDEHFGCGESGLGVVKYKKYFDQFEQNNHNYLRVCSTRTRNCGKKKTKMFFFAVLETIWVYLKVLTNDKAHWRKSLA